jgi:hypothetical protein
MTSFELLSRNLPGGTEEKHGQISEDTNLVRIKYWLEHACLVVTL